MNIRILRGAVLALALASTVLGASEASAHGPGRMFHFGHGGGFRGYGFGYNAAFYGNPLFGLPLPGCTVKRVIDNEGGIIFRKVCL